MVLLILEIIIWVTAECTPESLIVTVKDPFPLFFLNHMFFFDSTGYTYPFVSFFSFK